MEEEERNVLEFEKMNKPNNRVGLDLRRRMELQRKKQRALDRIKRLAEENKQEYLGRQGLQKLLVKIFEEEKINLTSFNIRTELPQDVVKRMFWNETKRGSRPGGKGGKARKRLKVGISEEMDVASVTWHNRMAILEFVPPPTRPLREIEYEKHVESWLRKEYGQKVKWNANLLARAYVRNHKQRLQDLGTLI